MYLSLHQGGRSKDKQLNENVTEVSDNQSILLDTFPCNSMKSGKLTSEKVLKLKRKINYIP